MSKAFKIWYGINVESREHALRGWNWGKADFTKAELSFNVQNRPAFEIPYSEISNTNLAGKNEVAVEFALSATDGNNANGQSVGSTQNRGRKAAAGPDELVEMRLYIPGTAVKKEKVEDADGKEEHEEEAEEQNAANLFYETLMDKAEIGDVAGDTFATFLDVLHLTPRSVASFLCLSEVSTHHHVTEVASILICTNHPSVYAAKLMTTRFNIPPSRSSFCFPRMMTLTPSLFWG